MTVKGDSNLYVCIIFELLSTQSQNWKGKQEERRGEERGREGKKEIEKERERERKKKWSQHITTWFTGRGKFRSSSELLTYSTEGVPAELSGHRSGIAWVCVSEMKQQNSMVSEAQCKATVPREGNSGGNSGVDEWALQPLWTNPQLEGHLIFACESELWSSLFTITYLQSLFPACSCDQNRDLQMPCFLLSLVAAT